MDTTGLDVRRRDGRVGLPHDGAVLPRLTLREDRTRRGTSGGHGDTLSAADLERHGIRAGRRSGHKQGDEYGPDAQHSPPTILISASQSGFLGSD